MDRNNASLWLDSQRRPLLVLANIEAINAEFIRMGLSQPERLRKLNEIAIMQLKSLVNNGGIGKLK